MSDPVGILIVLQAVGALVGAVFAVAAEIAYMRALADGVITNAERAHLKRLGQGLGFGLLLVLLASLGLVVEAYAMRATVQPALSAGYWTLIALSFVILLASWALARKRISFALGSAAAFTAWWFLAYLSAGFLPQMSFGAAVAFYVVALALFYGILHYARFLFMPVPKPHMP